MRPVPDDTGLFYSLEIMLCLENGKNFLLLFLHHDRIKCEQAYYGWPEKCCLLLYSVV